MLVGFFIQLRNKEATAQAITNYRRGAVLLGAGSVGFIALLLFFR
jgi:hypothetical protein